MDVKNAVGLSGQYHFDTIRSVDRANELGTDIRNLPRTVMVLPRFGRSRTALFVTRLLRWLRLDVLAEKRVPAVIMESSTDSNLIPTEGLNFVMNVLSQAGTTKISTWYLALGIGNYTVAATDTGANIVGAGRANETSLYDEATRVLLNWVAATTGVLTNSAAKATFTFNNTAVITNAFVVSTAPKADVAGTCLSSLKLGTAKTMAAADQLVVTFVLTASSV